MTELSDVSGIAALNILEPLLSALNGSKVLLECEILDVPEVAEAAQDNPSSGSETGEVDRSAQLAAKHRYSESIRESWSLPYRPIYRFVLGLS